MGRRVLASASRNSILVALVLSVAAPAATQDSAPRTPWGSPDLQGVWDFRTLTPLQRPEGLAEPRVPDQRRSGQHRAGGGRPRRAATQPSPRANDSGRACRRPSRRVAWVLQQLLARPGVEHGAHRAHIADHRSLRRAGPGAHPGGPAVGPRELRVLCNRRPRHTSISTPAIGVCLGSTLVRRSSRAATTRTSRCSRRRTMSC